MTLSSETLHASTVAIDGRAVLIEGRSGSGKSDLALRLIDRGARLVSDDYTVVRRREGTLKASAPTTIAGRIEVRGLGILTVEHLAEAPIGLVVSIGEPVERLPEPGGVRSIAGVAIPLVAIDALTASAPIKVEHALALFGIPV